MNATIENGSIEFPKTSLYAGCPEHGGVPYFSFTARRFYLALSVMSVVLTIATILPNSLFIAAMISYRRRITTGQKMLMVLSGVDLMQGLTMWPLKITFHLLQSRGSIDCVLLKALISVAFSLTWATITAIFLIALERYLAVALPFLHRRSVSFSKLFAVFMLSCSLSTVGGLALNLRLNEKEYWTIYKGILATAILILVAAVVVLQGHVTYIALRRSKKIGQHNAPERMFTRRRARAMKISLAIISTFFLAYSPVAAYHGYMAISKNSSTALRIYVQSTVQFVAVLNSIANPLVYYSRSHFVRRAVNQFFSKSSANDSPSNSSSKISM